MAANLAQLKSQGTSGMQREQNLVQQLEQTKLEADKLAQENDNIASVLQTLRQQAAEAERDQTHMRD
jgi:predicted ATPase